MLYEVHYGSGMRVDIYHQAAIEIPLMLFLMYSADKVGCAVSTAIYFLLPSGSVSRLHRIPCAKTWHFYKGEPLTVGES